MNDEPLTGYGPLPAEADGRYLIIPLLVLGVVVVLLLLCMATAALSIWMRFI